VDGWVRALRTPAARGEIINIGGSTPTEILRLAELVQQTLGIPQPLRARFVPYEALPGRYQDVRTRIPDTSKARELLGFDARVALEDGLVKTIEWHRGRRAAEQAARA
jgi:UDP-glucose 4-epimerase